MLRPVGWMVGIGIILGAASVADAQDSQLAGVPAPSVGSGYLGPYVDVGSMAAGAVPVIGSPNNCCFTLYPLSTISPYTYPGRGKAFGAYSFAPYPYAPVGFGWYGEYWRGW